MKNSRIIFIHPVHSEARFPRDFYFNLTQLINATISLFYISIWWRKKSTNPVFLTRPQASTLSPTNIVKRYVFFFTDEMIFFYFNGFVTKSFFYRHLTFPLLTTFVLLNVLRWKAKKLGLVLRPNYLRFRRKRCDYLNYSDCTKRS